MTDRLGSVVQRGTTRLTYYPYGEEKGTVTGQDTEKFGTYYRDGMTGLDYADQRYFQHQWGRFTSPDPSEPGDPADPGSWNLYAYVQGDPINFLDPSGLIKCGEVQSGVGNLSIRNFMTGTNELSLLADIMWHEAGPMYSGDDWDTLRSEQLFIGTAMMNRLDMSRGTLVGYGNDGKPHAYNFGNSLRQVILRAGGDNQSWGIFDGGRLSGVALDRLNNALNAEVGNPQNGDDILARSRECAAVVSGIFGMAQIVGGVRFDPVGGIALFWNSSANLDTKASDIELNPELVNLGRTTKVRGNVFFGLWSYPHRAFREPDNPRQRGAPREQAGGGRSQ